VEPLDVLHSKIPNFPGYDDDASRRHSDEYVRSYLGEALTEYAARCQLSAEVQARLDELVLRLEFADPRSFATHHNAARHADDGGAVATADAAAVELAERARTLGPAAMSDYLDDVSAVLDERVAAIRAAALR